MRYLTVEEVLRISEMEAGPNLCTDRNLLESAVFRPQMTVGGEDAYPDVHRKAAALFHSLVRNHCFIDGNKRTAAIASLVFYQLNGWWIEMEQDELYDLTIEAAEGAVDVPNIASRFEVRATRSPDPEP